MGYFPLASAKVGLFAEMAKDFEIFFVRSVEKVEKRDFPLNHVGNLCYLCIVFERINN